MYYCIIVQVKRLIIKNSSECHFYKAHKESLPKNELIPDTQDTVNILAYFYIIKMNNLLHIDNLK